MDADARAGGAAAVMARHLPNDAGICVLCGLQVAPEESPVSLPRFLVAEMSKNWPEQELLAGVPISTLFERCIAFNVARGYRLHSFHFHQAHPAPGALVETIIAVFEQDDGPEPEP